MRLWGIAVLEIIKAGGWLMVPILLCSIVALAISIERYWTLSPRKIVPRNLLAQVWVWINHNQLDANRLRELRQGSPLGRILAAGLSNYRHGRDVMKESIEEAANHVVHELERFLDALGTIAGIAPLLGLLGTVVGMIDMFNEMQARGSNDITALAGGLSQALITTAAGLIVAIPTLIAHRYFMRRVDALVVTMEQETIKLVDALHGDRQVQSREGAA